MGGASYLLESQSAGLATYIICIVVIGQGTCCSPGGQDLAICCSPGGRDLVICCSPGEQYWVICCSLCSQRI